VSTTATNSAPAGPNAAVADVWLTVAQAVVRYLQMQFSERDGQQQRLIAGVFGIFGHGNVTGMGQALDQYGEALPYYQARNEQSMVHAAIGYTRAMRRRTLLACTSSIGPGATNMVTGAATATINRLPVLLLPGDYYASRRQGTVLQQLEHTVSADVSVNDCLRPVSRFFDRITRPEQLLASLPEAMRVLTDPADTGAATIALPQDVQTEAYRFPLSFFEPHVWHLERRQPEPGAIAAAIEAISGASRPAIIAGGGVHFSEAWVELRAFSDAFGIPVAETFAGKGSLIAASEIGLGGLGVEGNPAANAVLREADLVICVGTRLTDFTTASRSLFQDPAVRFISLNVNERDAFKMGALPVVADAREGLRALTHAGQEHGLRPRAEYVATVRDRRDRWQGRVTDEVYRQIPGEAMSQGQLIGVLNDAARSGDLVIAAAGGPVGDLQKLWDPTGGRAAHLEFGYSCMGHELPAAIGARLAMGPAGEVIAFIGDGTFLMSPTELVTAMQEGLKITVVISDNGGFQVIRRLQMSRVGQEFGNEFRARGATSNRLDGPYLQIDMGRMAEGMGACAWHAHDEASLRDALRLAREQSGSSVIIVEIERHRFLPPSEVWWDAAPPETSADDETMRLRSEYERDRQAQRFFG
jgi:3D-(3,5/4)-trihydroxycyclohexane-1,2-dione acylhydrolase (decyclizing)